MCIPTGGEDCGDRLQLSARFDSPSGEGVTFHYDGLGRRDYQYLLNGASATLARDPLDRLTQLATIVAPPNHFTLDFTYNPASGIATNTRSNDAYAWSGHYAVNRAYTTDGLNRYSAISSITPNPTYDANGNLTSAGGATYTYDVENRLVAASGGVTLTYDPLGRLSQIATSGGATRRFGYDGDALIDEFDGAGNVRRVYVHGPGVDEPMFWWDIPGATWGTLQADERGSIVAVANNGGAAATINRYDEYGIPAATNAGAFQYTGQVWLPELGMYHYKARIYSPTLGRFLQTDPVGYEDQFNLYAYVGNDPVNLSDPSGRIQRNRNGSFRFRRIGGPTLTRHPADRGPPVRVQRGYLYADNGNRIEAFRNLSGTYVYDTDCHGYTFTGGAYWINDDQAARALAGDHYAQVGTPQAGDVAIYSREGQIVHSGVVTSIDPERGPMVTNDAGIRPEGVLTQPAGPGPGTAADPRDFGPVTVTYHRRPEDYHDVTTTGSRIRQQ